MVTYFVNCIVLHTHIACDIGGLVMMIGPREHCQIV